MVKPIPDEWTGSVQVRVPPASGPGSGKEAWRALALRAIEANEGLMLTVQEQAAALRELKAEVALLRRQIASRRPPGGRDPLPDVKVARIENAIRAGESTRSIARGFKVSAMTVSRVARRMRERDALPV